MSNKFKKILLIIIGLVLIGISVFNIFNEPLMSAYYRIKRKVIVAVPLPSHQKLTYLTPWPTMPNPVKEEFDLNNTVGIQATPNFTPQTLPKNEEVDGFLPIPVAVEKEPELRATQEKIIDVIPVRLSIPIINLNADIIFAQQEKTVQNGITYIQWLAPDEFAVGWHYDSARLGAPGNTVLNGHHNVFGKVFENLDKLVSGDQISIYGNDLNIYHYIVTNVMILPERDVSFEERLKNAQWIMPSEDERITLITCWPYFSNTHRLIIVARPNGVEPVRLEKRDN